MNIKHIAASFLLFLCFSCNTCTSVQDMDGNKYKITTTGKLKWMTENLKVLRYNDGSPILRVEDTETWKHLQSGACCWYNNADSCKTKYGILYNWYAVNTGKLCPRGWRVPTDEDWKYLEGYVDSKYKIGDSIWNRSMNRGFNVGNQLKANSGWNSNGNGVDAFGFKAFPGGERSSNTGNFHHIGNNGFWWSSSENDSTSAWYRCLLFFDEKIIRNTHPKGMGFSVRCVRLD